MRDELLPEAREDSTSHTAWLDMAGEPLRQPDPLLDAIERGYTPGLDDA